MTPFLLMWCVFASAPTTVCFLDGHLLAMSIYSEIPDNYGSQLDLYFVAEL